jgi:DNA-3-methyladenine glycosylase I
MNFRTSGEITRCHWALASRELRQYHDREYGFPVKTSRAYFERLILEIFQAGLSWRTVLAKRSAFRCAFAGFTARRVAGFSATEVERLMRNPGIIRNRRKIMAAIENARRFLDCAQRPGGFRAFILSLPLRDRTATVKVFRRTFVFMGPKIVEEFLMSTGHWPVRHEPRCFLSRRKSSGMKN